MYSVLRGADAGVNEDEARTTHVVLKMGRTWNGHILEATVASLSLFLSLRVNRAMLLLLLELLYDLEAAVSPVRACLSVKRPFLDKIAVFAIT